MDTNNPVIKLCIEGTKAEYKGEKDIACTLYEQAWEVTRDDYEACIAAHYVARYQEDPKGRLYWNQVALQRANAVGDNRVQEFYPSLYLNMGYSHELLGDRQEAKRYYDLAAALGAIHQAD